jgi:glycosyltransferase involved in cell wall biosynthesis
MNVGLVCNVDVDYGLDLANVLTHVGERVTLYLSRAQAARAVSCVDRTLERIYELNLLPLTCQVRLFQFPRMRDPRSLLAVRLLGKSMHEDGIELVHILMGPGEFWLGVLSCLVRDIPVVSTMITPVPHAGDDPSGFVVRVGYRLLAAGSDIVIVNGKSQVQLVHRIYGVPINRVVHVPLGIRTTALKWANGKFPEEPGTVLFSGAARPHKGLEYLVRAQPRLCRQVPSARIVIASYGKDFERCVELIEDRSKFEIHSGFIRGDVMAALFQRASLVALPYLDAASSGILMTAMAFGKPVVATNIDGLAEYVRDGSTGLLVSPGNANELADAMARLLANNAWRAETEKNIASWASELQEQVIVKTASAFEKAISCHSHSSTKHSDTRR